MPCSLRNRMRCSRGIRRSWLPGMRYPRSRPESNHLLTVRGATLQIFATWPVVKTFFMAGTPYYVIASLLPIRRACPAGDHPPTPHSHHQNRAAAGTTARGFLPVVCASFLLDQGGVYQANNQVLA